MQKLKGSAKKLGGEVNHQPPEWGSRPLSTYDHLSNWPVHAHSLPFWHAGICQDGRQLKSIPKLGCRTGMRGIFNGRSVTVIGDAYTS